MIDLDQRRTANGFSIVLVDIADVDTLYCTDSGRSSCIRLVSSDVAVYCLPLQELDCGEKNKFISILPELFASSKVILNTDAVTVVAVKVVSLLWQY